MKNLLDYKTLVNKNEAKKNYHKIFHNFIKKLKLKKKLRRYEQEQNTIKSFSNFFLSLEEKF